MTNQEIWERYPYLRPRNIWTGELLKNADYTRATELPDGWHNLFMQMCEDIRQPLIEADCLDIFQFSQLKEKWGVMRAYHFGAPTEVYNIIHNYETLSKYVCQHCGAPATMKTSGWIGYYCEDCAKNHQPDDYVPFERPEKIVSTHYDYSEDNKGIKVECDLRPLWNRLYGKEEQ